MGLWSKLEKEKELFGRVPRVVQEIEDLWGRFNKMVEERGGLTPERKEQLADLKELIAENLMARDLGDLWKQGVKPQTEKYLAKYQVPSRQAALAQVAGEINETFNLLNTPERQWLNLQSKFWEYRASNFTELSRLQKMSQETRLFKANYLMSGAQKAEQDLVAEENALREKVQSLKPQNGKVIEGFKGEYQRTLDVLTGKLALYQERGRSPVLQAQQRPDGLQKWLTGIQGLREEGKTVLPQELEQGPEKSI